MMFSSAGGIGMRGVINIIIGIVFIVGGLSGHLVLIGTSSGPALAAVGAAMIGLGIFRIVKARGAGGGGGGGSTPMRKM
jgi:hypothetical protein